MDDFPDFMKTEDNAISDFLQAPGAEGWIYDGKDGKQVAYWLCHEDVDSPEHTHTFDEYFVIVQGEFRMVVEGKETVYHKGGECFIPAGTPHSGFALKGSRTIHCFGGKRA